MDEDTFLVGESFPSTIFKVRPEEGGMFSLIFSFPSVLLQLILFSMSSYLCPVILIGLCFYRFTIKEESSRITLDCFVVSAHISLIYLSRYIFNSSISLLNS
jgi:hypothetical protein